MRWFAAKPAAVLCATAALAFGTVGESAATIVTSGCTSPFSCTLFDLSQGGSFSAGGFTFANWFPHPVSYVPGASLRSFVVLPVEDNGSFGFQIVGHPSQGIDNPLSLQGPAQTSLDYLLGLTYFVEQNASVGIGAQQVRVLTADANGTLDFVALDTRLTAHLVDIGGRDTTVIAGIACSAAGGPACAQHAQYLSTRELIPAYGQMPGFPLGFTGNLDVVLHGGFPDPGSYYGLGMVEVRYQQAAEPPALALLACALGAAGLSGLGRRGRQHRRPALA